MKILPTLCLLMAFLAVTACGQIGPLYLPVKEEASGSSAPSAKEMPENATTGQY